MISASWPRSRKYSPIVQPEYAETYCIAADSDADAATTMVYSIAPACSSARTTFLIDDARSQWDPETLAEEPSDGDRIRAMFENENRRLRLEACPPASAPRPE